MIFDYLVDLLHHANRFAQRHRDLLVVDYVILRQDAAFPVFKPFQTDLVCADMKVPHCVRYTAEASRLRVVEPHSVARVTDFLDLWIWRTGVGGNGLVEFRRLKQMKAAKFVAEFRPASGITEYSQSTAGAGNRSSGIPHSDSGRGDCETWRRHSEIYLQE